MIGIVIALAFGALASAPAQQTDEGETTISYAGNGGLRDWQRIEKEPRILYARDRAERWYRIAMTGPCGTRDASETIIYTTDSNGTFDRFSSISTARYPDQMCRVTSIRRTPPPPSIRSRPPG